MGVSPCTRGATSGLPFWRRKPGPVPRPRRCASACAPLSPPLKAVSQGSSDAQILDLSNRFYTLIPHDFGMKKPPLLNNADSVKVAGVQEGAAGPLAVVLAGGCPPPCLPLHVTVFAGRGQCWEGHCPAIISKWGFCPRRWSQSTGRAGSVPPWPPPHRGASRRSPPDTSACEREDGPQRLSTAPRLLPPPAAPQGAVPPQHSQKSSAVFAMARR